MTEALPLFMTVVLELWIVCAAVTVPLAFRIGFTNVRFGVSGRLGSAIVKQLKQVQTVL